MTTTSKQSTAAARADTGHRGEGQRLHIASGGPWLTALVSALGSRRARAWHADRYEAGDLILMVLATRPRMIVSLERAEHAGGGPRSHVIGRRSVRPVAGFEGPLVPVTAVERRTDHRFPRTGTVGDEHADEILDVLRRIRKEGHAEVEEFGGHSCSDLPSGWRAAAIQRAAGVCAACETDFGSLPLDGAGYLALDVHRQARDPEHPDRLHNEAEELLALCASCHAIVRALAEPGGPAEPVEALRRAWRRL